jgi:hypothetical protein
MAPPGRGNKGATKEHRLTEAVAVAPLADNATFVGVDPIAPHFHFRPVKDSLFQPLNLDVSSRTIDAYRGSRPSLTRIIFAVVTTDWFASRRITLKFVSRSAAAVCTVPHLHAVDRVRGAKVHLHHA